MPRAKSTYPEEYGILFHRIAWLKSYSADLLHDAKSIYQTQLVRFEDWLSAEDTSEMSDRIKALSGLNIKIANERRAYIVCGDTFFRLVMYSLDEAVFDNLLSTYRFLSTVGDANLEYVSPEYRSGLFLFKGKELVLHAELSAGQTATLIAVFHKENLINFSGARYDYYGKPRAEAKRSLTSN